MNLVYTLCDGIITRTGHDGPPYPLQKMSRCPESARRLALENLEAVIAHMGEGAVRTALWNRGNGKLERLI